MHIIEEINVRRMIIHILDNQLTTPVLSGDEIQSSMDTKQFFASHILKVINNDDMKPCIFDHAKNPLIDMLGNYRKDLFRETDPESIDFVDMSKEAAVNLFEIMATHVMIPACDLAVIEFNLMTKPYIAFLKLDYESTYQHFTDYEDDSMIKTTTIMEHKTTLPGPKKKVSEAIIIDMSEMTMKVLEKKHELDGMMGFYLSRLYMKCSTKLSSKTQMKIVKQAVGYNSAKFYEHDPVKQVQMKINLYEAVEDNGVINLAAYAEGTFEDQEEVKEVLLDRLEKKGLDVPMVKLDEATIEREFNKQKIKTGKGIELVVPMHLYSTPKEFEFITGEDGKLQILIKDISKIMA